MATARTSCECNLREDVRTHRLCGEILSFGAVGGLINVNWVIF